MFPETGISHGGLGYLCAQQRWECQTGFFCGARIVTHGFFINSHFQKTSHGFVLSLTAVFITCPHGSFSAFSLDKLLFLAVSAYGGETVEVGSE